MNQRPFAPEYTMFNYRSLLRVTTDAVERHLIHQVDDPDRPDAGVFLGRQYGFAVVDHTCGGRVLALAMLAWLAEGSPYFGSQELHRRLLLGVEGLRHCQRPTGLIDLPKVDFDSPPDTAFLVQMLCPAVELLRRAADEGNPQAATLADALDSFLEPAAKGIIGRGFRTPNHRWVVASALSYAQRLYPGLESQAYIDAVLAEGIDIDADGQFSERSSAIYTAVCNRALRMMADHLDRPTLLDHVRRSLEFTEHLLRSDDTVVTIHSHRQDASQRARPVSMADSFFDMAHRDGNGRWAAIADRLAHHADETDVFWLLVNLLLEPERIQRRVPAQPIRRRYNRVFPASGLWRLEEGKISMTASVGTETPFSMSIGGLYLRGIRIRSSYFHYHTFRPQALEPIHDQQGEAIGVRLTQPAVEHGAAWDLPLGRPVVFEDPAEYYRVADGGERRKWRLPPLQLALEVRRIDSGITLRLTSNAEALSRIPCQFDLIFDPKGVWESGSTVTSVSPDQVTTLKAGCGVLHTEDHAFEVGPGLAEHRLNTTEPSRDGGFTVRVLPLTPIDHTLTVRFGRWSHASQRFVPLHELPTLDNASAAVHDPEPSVWAGGAAIG